MSKLQLIQGDCLDKLKELADNSVDSIVTDPPYELGFMGKSWDNTGIANNKDMWAECLRVLKPGGYLLAFGGTRTYHRMASAIEDAGFEVRDMIEWVYGSGFPKSLNIGKAVDKLQGNEREDLGLHPQPGKAGKTHTRDGGAFKDDIRITKGTSEWEGWGTSLKPSHEPICMARKPLAEKTVAENCLKWGTGGINIDGCRVDYNGEIPNIGGRANHTRGDGYGFKELGENIEANTQGRFPANLIHDGSDEVVGLFPNSKGGGGHSSSFNPYGGNSFNTSTTKKIIDKPTGGMNDSGSASRFFKSIIYQAKASKSERNKGCEGLEEKANIYMARANGTGGIQPGMERFATLPKANNHPTVKPIALMEYLIKMVTPKGGIVLDPFMGSGTTGIACRKLNYGFIGIELEPDYITIAKARIDSIKAVQEKLL